MPPVLRHFANAVGVALFALLFLVFVIQVTARFAFNQPLGWTDEAAVVLYLWAILWAAAVICKDREHVSFDLLYAAAPAPLRRAMAMLSCALMGTLCAWAIPASWDYTRFMRRESTPVLGLPLSWVFAPFTLLLLTLVWRYALRLWRLGRGNWRAYL